MADTPPPDKNDQALVQYLLRGIRRFAKHVRAQEMFQTTDETVEARIATAYRLAHAQFESVKENQSWQGS